MLGSGTAAGARAVRGYVCSWVQGAGGCVGVVLWRGLAAWPQASGPFLTYGPGKRRLPAGAAALHPHPRQRDDV